VKSAPEKVIAALAWNDIDAHATGRVLGARGRRIHVHFLRSDRIDVDGRRKTG